METKNVFGSREKIILIVCLLILSLLCITKYLCWLLDILDTLKKDDVDTSLKSWYGVFKGVSINLTIIGFIFAILPFLTLTFKDVEIGKKIFILMNVITLLSVFAVVALSVSASLNAKNNGGLVSLSMVADIDNINILSILFSLGINNLIQYMCMSINYEIFNQKKSTN